MSETYDNHRRGALFTTDENTMEGPFHLNSSDEPDTRALLIVDPTGNDHDLSIYETGANGQRKGKPIAKGTVRGTNARPNANGQMPPVARGVLRVKGGDQIKVCLWKQTKQDGTDSEFFQIAPDEFEPSTVPSLANAS